MVCPRCLVNNENFRETCKNCGYRLGWMADHGKKRSSSRKYIYFVVVLLIAGALAGAFFVFFYSKDTSGVSGLYIQAESLYKQKEYKSALMKYQEILSRYPNNALADLSQRKVDEIRIRLDDATVQRQKDRERIGVLLEKAEEAFHKQRFLTPESDNVMLYLNELHTIEPYNVRSLEMKTKIVAFYDKKLSEAFRDENYLVAQDYCKKILNIFPDHSVTKGYLSYIEELLENSRKDSLKINLKIRPQFISPQLMNNKKQNSSRDPLRSRLNLVTQPPPRRDTLPPRPASPPNSAPRKPAKRSTVGIGIPRFIAQNQGEWGAVVSYLKTDVKILKINDRNLIIYTDALNDSLNISMKKSSNADIYASIEKNNVGKNARVWIISSKVWQNTELADDYWNYFFDIEFMQYLRPPPGF